MAASSQKPPVRDFDTIFKKLRGILLSHAEKFVVSVDKPDHYCLAVSFSPKFRKSFPIAWVKVSKSYVGFHFMPIYFAPSLKKSLSAKLKARMHGKSCFNFKTSDPVLFEELDRLAATGFALSKNARVL